MPHGHPSGWAPQEIGLFIDSKCRGGTPLPIPGKPAIEGDQVKLNCQSRTPLNKVELNYTTDEGPRSKRDWTTVPAAIEAVTTLTVGASSYSTTITAPKPPGDANTWFLTITDDRDAMVSTTVQIQ
jgi:hypothetical protein